MLKKGAIKQALFSSDQYLSSYLFIKRLSGAKRLILNLKSFNTFIQPPHFKIKDLKIACHLLSQDDFMATLDLEDAYLLISVHEDHRKYLRFPFQSEIDEFTALPFGLASAPFIFIKILISAVYWLREKRFAPVNYLDDFLTLGGSFENCEKNVNATRKLLITLGFVVNESKCELTPSRTRKFLSFVLDSYNMRISLADEKRIALRMRTEKFRQKSSCRISDFASLIASLVSACRAVPYGMLYTKALES